MKRLAILGLVLLLFVPACQEDRTDRERPSEKDNGPFQKLNYPGALAKARSEKKVVFIDFYGDGCPPCRRLESETFRDGEVRQLLASKTVALRVNVADNHHLAAQFNVMGIPCLVFLDSDGQTIGRLEGFRTATQFLEEARKFVP